MASFSVPFDTIADIAAHSTLRARCSLSLVSHDAREAVLPLLCRCVTIRSAAGVASFLALMTSNPRMAGHVQSLEITARALPLWPGEKLPRSSTAALTDALANMHRLRHLDIPFDQVLMLYKATPALKGLRSLTSIVFSVESIIAEHTLGFLPPMTALCITYDTEDLPVTGTFESLLRRSRSTLKRLELSATFSESLENLLSRDSQCCWPTVERLSASLREGSSYSAFPNVEHLIVPRDANPSALCSALAEPGDLRKLRILELPWDIPFDLPQTGDSLQSRCVQHISRYDASYEGGSLDRLKSTIATFGTASLLSLELVRYSASRCAAIIRALPSWLDSLQCLSLKYFCDNLDGYGDMIEAIIHIAPLPSLKYLSFEDGRDTHVEEFDDIMLRVQDDLVQNLASKHTALRVVQFRLGECVATWRRVATQPAPRSHPSAIVRRISSATNDPFSAFETYSRPRALTRQIHGPSVGSVDSRPVDSRTSGWRVYLDPDDAAFPKAPAIVAIEELLATS